MRIDHNGFHSRRPSGRQRGRRRLKTHDIELQRLRSARHDKGMIEIGADVAVAARPLRDDAAGSSLRLSVADARTLLLLLKQELGELDKTQPRSRRSGRA